MKNIKNNFIYKIIKSDIKKKKYKKIITRFPPEPNGYLHIGHIKSIYINFNISKKFNGKFYLRFDDTNPKTEKKIYIKNIKKEIKWLKFKWNGKEKYSSDYFKIYYNYAIELIKKKLAYVDELSIKKIKKYRGKLNKPGKKSPYRNRKIKENILLFNKMKNGYIKEGKMCLRAKINMKSKNILMRDPIIYRIKKNKHPKTKNKWCIYPMYDFAHCIADSIEKISHSICTLEFQNNKNLYNWVLNNISIKHKPKQYEFSRLNITHNITSKRKINELIKKKIISGWDDPRLLTISGMKNRGYTPNSIKNFCKSLGISKQESIINYSILENSIRKELNKITPRLMGIINPIKIIITNLNKNFFIKINISNHPFNKKMGIRKIIFSKEIYIDKKDFKEKKTENFKRLVLGKKIILKYAGIIKSNKIIKDKKGNILYIECKYLGKNISLKKKLNIIHWLSKKNILKTKYILYEKLFNVINPNKEKNFLSKINKNSIKKRNGYIEKNILNYVNKYKSFQFEREGYFKLSKNSKKHNLIFERIVSLKKNNYNFFK